MTYPDSLTLAWYSVSPWWDHYLPLLMFMQGYRICQIQPGGPTSQSYGAAELVGVGNARAAVRRRAPGVRWGTKSTDRYLKMLLKGRPAA